jgi:hypothetical protein
VLVIKGCSFLEGLSQALKTYSKRGALYIASGGSSGAERRRFGQGSSTASRTSEEAVTRGQTRSKKLKSKNFTGILYLHSIRQLQ